MSCAWLRVAAVGTIHNCKSWCRALRLERASVWPGMYSEFCRPENSNHVLLLLLSCWVSFCLSPPEFQEHTSPKRSRKLPPFSPSFHGYILKNPDRLSQNDGLWGRFNSLFELNSFWVVLRLNNTLSGAHVDVIISIYEWSLEHTKSYNFNLRVKSGAHVEL